LLAVAILLVTDLYAKSQPSAEGVDFRKLDLDPMGVAGAWPKLK